MEKVKKKTRGDISFESALKELETIANRLEDGSLSLDKSIEEFEHGVKLARFCHNKLQRQNAGSRFSRKEILANH